MREKHIMIHISLTLFLFSFLLFPVQTKAADTVASGTCGSDVSWSFTSDGLLSIQGSGRMYNYSPTSNDFSPWNRYSNQIIRIKIDTGVTSIGEYAFWNCTNMTDIIVPDSVTVINHGAFMHCTSLTEITLPESIQQIGQDVFWNCSGLTKINIPDSVTYIGNDAFAGCSSLNDITGVNENIRWIVSKNTGTLTFQGTGKMPNYNPVRNNYAPWNSYKNIVTSVIIKEGITNIGGYNFWNFGNLEHITIPESVTRIEFSAFLICGLKEISLPASVTVIEDSAFMNSALTKIEMPGVTTIERNAFSGCKVSSVFLPDSVTKIGYQAFQNCANLTSVRISNGVSSLRGAFEECISLASVEIPNGVTDLSSAFKGCTSLASIEIPNSVTDLFSAFEECTSLASVKIPNSVTNLYSAFKGCSSLVSIEIPKGVINLSSAFEGCTSLRSVKIPSSVTELYASFKGCTSLISAELLPGITQPLSSTFEGCTSLTSITLPEGITALAMTFKGCTSLTSIDIPNSVTTLDTSVFENCSSLASVTISDSVTEIGSNTFKGCSSLTEITIPNSVASLGFNVFQACSQLTSVTISDSVQILRWDIFSECPELEKITILNPVCQIRPGVFSAENITLYGYDRSTAYDYAALYGIAFHSIGKPSVSYWKPQLPFTHTDYTGEEIRPLVLLENLEENVDFTVTYRDNINAGMATIQIDGIGDCTGSLETQFSIDPISIRIYPHILDYESAVYTGSAIEPSVTIEGLQRNTDYTVSYSNNINAGYAAVTITGIGNYTEYQTAHFSITARDISDMKGILEYETTEYTGVPRTPSVAMKNMDPKTDYSCSYQNNTDAGTATVTVTGTKNCKGSFSMNFQITPKSIENCTVTLPTRFHYTYSGSKKEPEPSIPQLTAERDYTVTYENNTNAGTAAVLLEGKGNYRGHIRVPFTITPASLNNTDFSIPVSSCIYNGTAQEPDVTAKNNLLRNADYTVTYTDNVNTGTASAIITGTGNYTGSITKTFQIEPQSIKGRAISLSQDTFFYDGVPKAPAVLIEGLQQDTDFRVSYKDNTNAGTAVIYISGIHNYTEEAVRSFTIIPKSILDMNCSLEQTSYVYDGKAKYPAVSLPNLENQKDYNISYKNNTQVGTATVIITGIRNYQGILEAKFEITPKENSSSNPADPGNTTKPDNTTNPSDSKKPDRKPSSSGLSAGQIITMGGVQYKATSDRTMAFHKITNKNISMIDIPDAITYNSNTYKITSISANALKDNKTLRQITFGKNIERIGNNALRSCTALISFSCTSTKLSFIGKNAFYGDKNLTSVCLKTTKLKKSGIGANAFKKINKKCIFKVPKKKIRAYKSIFKSKGAGKKIKVTKI